MVSSALSILFEIFFVILSNTVNTIISVIMLFIKLLYSLNYGISIAGPLGIFLAFIVLLPLTYILAKFFLGSVKIALIAFLILFLFLTLALLI